MSTVTIVFGLFVSYSILKMCSFSSLLRHFVICYSKIDLAKKRNTTKGETCVFVADRKIRHSRKNLGICVNIGRE